MSLYILLKIQPETEQKRILLNGVIR